MRHVYMTLISATSYFTCAALVQATESQRFVDFLCFALAALSAAYCAWRLEVVTLREIAEARAIARVDAYHEILTDKADRNGNR